MLRVALTGGIGSGKSTIAGRLVECGAVLIDADQIAREVVEPGTEGLAELVAAFGEDILDADGALDRSVLAAFAFANDENRARLNSIVHPRIGVRTAELFAEAAEDAIVVHEIPLLVESGMAPAYHLVLVTHADEEQRVHRLVSARGMDASDAKARIAAQADDNQRRAVADVWLDNSGSPEQVLPVVDEVWRNRLVPYEANLRARRPADYGSLPRVDADPGWPMQAWRLAGRVRLAAGAAVRRVDHVGPTAVPGLPASDLLELQVTVGSTEDADAITDALAHAGFPPLPRDGGPHEYGGADPARPVRLAVVVAGSAGWDTALLMRDWLRDTEPARSEYVEHADRAESWLVEAVPRAESWARDTAWTA